MPIYEYESIDPTKGCRECKRGFEVIQGRGEALLASCPRCGQPVRKIISWCRAAVVEGSDEHARTERRIGEYERQGMWSHAAELADTYSEKVKDRGLKTRALDDYKRAGYDVASLEKHAARKDD